MSLPPIIRTWKQLLTTGTPGLRIPFVSLIDTMQNAMFTTKDFLVNSSGASTKLTVVWSASGGTGPANAGDHTDRWTSAATVTPRAAGAGASQGWIVLLDGNGAQHLLTYQGASDDIFRMSYSPGALFTLAGTTNQQPTATDEQVYCTGQTVIGATASADRILHVWASDDAKAFRVGYARSGVFTGVYWGAETFSQGLTAPASISPVMWGFSFGAGSTMSAGNIFGAFTANTKGGLCRTLVSSVSYNCQVTIGTENSNGVNVVSAYTFQPELQGAGFVPYPVSLHTNNATGSRGRLGNAIDWWTVAPSGVIDGDGIGNSYQFWQIGCVLVPNPSAVAPTIT